MKHWLIILTCLAAGIVHATANTTESWSPQSLRTMVVDKPDSVLKILDRAESIHPKELPPFRIAILRGLAYNEKRMFSLVERYALEALKSDSIANYPNEQLNALTLLSGAQRYYGDYQGCVSTATQAIVLAREIGNKPAELNILTTMAQNSFDIGERERGYEYLRQVIDSGSSSNSIRDLANVSAAYGVKVVELYADGRFREALTEGFRRLELIDRMDELGGAPEGYTDQQRAYAYARIASSAYMAGDSRAAQEAYENFMSTVYGQSVIGRAYITDYLLESGQWAKILEFTAPLFPLFEQADTINDDFRSLLVSNAKAKYGLGNQKDGYLLLERASVIQDSLYFREKNSKAQELATIFAVNEKELELQASKSQSQRRQMLLIASSGAAILVMIILVILWAQYRNTLRRNRIAAQQIDELTAQRERLLMAEKSGKICVDPKENEFQQIERKIIDERIFTNPDLNRDSLAEACGVSRAKIMQLLQTNTGLTPNDYINKLRVEYSINLIKQHPEWTIDAIAQEAGYVRRATYYSHFNKTYGITPAQYRKNTSTENS